MLVCGQQVGDEGGKSTKAESGRHTCCTLSGMCLSHRTDTDSQIFLPIRRRSRTGSKAGTSSSAQMQARAGRPLLRLQ